MGKTRIIVSLLLVAIFLLVAHKDSLTPKNDFFNWEATFSLQNVTASLSTVPYAIEDANVTISASEILLAKKEETEAPKVLVTIPVNSSAASNSTTNIYSQRSFTYSPLIESMRQLNQDVRRQIKDMLQRTRYYKNPKFSVADVAKGLLAQPVEGRQQRIIMVTYFRSGSSFLGDLLQQPESVFYHFEPLHYMTKEKRIEAVRTQEAFELLKSLSGCQFPEFYLRWALLYQKQAFFQKNNYLWKMCKGHKDGCFHPEIVAAICQRANYQLMKLTRVDLSVAAELLKGDANMKLVYLIRDPRGIMASRLPLHWCVNNSCVDANVLCGDMSRDVDTLASMPEALRKRIFVLRYEDLASQIETQSFRLYSFLGLPYGTRIKNFLKSHTTPRKGEEGNPYSTYRNTTVTPFLWKTKLKPEKILEIQTQCEPLLKKLGYPLYDPFANQNNSQ